MVTNEIGFKKSLYGIFNFLEIRFIFVSITSVIMTSTLNTKCKSKHIYIYTQQYQYIKTPFLTCTYIPHSCAHALLLYQSRNKLAHFYSYKHTTCKRGTRAISIAEGCRSLTELYHARHTLIHSSFQILYKYISIEQ